MQRLNIESMDTEKIRSIATSITQLTEEERQFLIGELHPNEYFRNHLGDFLITSQNKSKDLNFRGTKFTIIYLNDHNYRCLSKYFERIGFRAFMGSCFRGNPREILGRRFLTDFFGLYEKSPSIGEIYWILSYLFGRCNHSFCGSKGTFSFPFYLEINKQEKVYSYAFSVFDWRGSVEFDFYRCSEEEVVDNHDYCNANESEFSAEEIDCFFAYFIGYLLGFSEVVEKKITPFYKIVQSNCFIFGYSHRQDDFFEYEFSNEEDKKSFLQTNGFAVG
jgi:hypothetical protein